MDLHPVHDFCLPDDIKDLEFHYCKLLICYSHHHPPPRPGLEDDKRICKALSAINFSCQVVYAKFWAAIEFKSASCYVLTTRGQPFGFSMYTNKFKTDLLACLNRNSYVHGNKSSYQHPNPIEEFYIGLPGHAFRDGTTKQTQNTCIYENNEVYSREQDAWNFFMPVFEAEDDKCRGVLEISMTNPWYDTTDSNQFVDEVCRALEEQGLRSSREIQPGIDEDYTLPRKGNASNSHRITRNDVTKYFGHPKKVASNKFDVNEKTFGDAHRAYNIEVWPGERHGVYKSYAHHALINGETRLKEVEDFLMQYNDNINYEDNVVAHRDDGIKVWPYERTAVYKPFALINWATQHSKEVEDLLMPDNDNMNFEDNVVAHSA